MVLLEVHSLGHGVLIDSYCNHLAVFVGDKIINRIRETMHYCANVICEFVRTQPLKQAVQTGPNFLVNNMIQVLDTFVHMWAEQEENRSGDPDAPPIFKTPSPAIAEDILNNALVYALIWGIGAQIEETTRPKFDKFLQEILLHENVVEKYKLDLDIPEPRQVKAKMPEYQSLFDLCYQTGENAGWTNWMKTVPEYQVPKDCTYVQVVVPTLDSIRVNNNLSRLLKAGKHTLIVGPTGTGKSISIIQELKSNFVNEHYNYVSLAFSA